MKIYKQKTGFTLAEVLLTLTIIGIVAALTIPSLVNNINDVEMVSRLKKYQSVLAQATINYMTQNNYSSLSESPLSSNYDPVSGWNYYKTQFNIVKDCGTATGTDCWTHDPIKYLNGNVTTGDINNWGSAGMGILADGASIRYEAKSYCSTNRSTSGAGPLYNSSCAMIYIDVNGVKPPNTFGRDVFLWHLVREGQVYPLGALDDTWSGCDPASSDVSAGSNGAPGAGPGCTAKVLLEGKINY